MERYRDADLLELLAAAKAFFGGLGWKVEEDPPGSNSLLLSPSSQSDSHARFSLGLVPGGIRSSIMVVTKDVPPCWVTQSIERQPG